LLLHRTISRPAHAERQDNRVRRFGVPSVCGTGTKRTSTALSSEPSARNGKPLAWNMTDAQTVRFATTADPVSRFVALYALLYAAFGVSSPFLPAFIETRGIGVEQIGLIFAAGTALRLVSASLAGRLVTGSRSGVRPSLPARWLPWLPRCSTCPRQVWPPL
jgi:hypothetical protein